MVHSRFADAFSPGCRFLHELFGPIRMTPELVGELKVPTGRIVASDPFTTDFARTHVPLPGLAPAGSFPVEIAIADLDNGNQLVACARVRFADRPAVRWSKPSQPDRIGTADAWDDGYGVDSGTGCFFDAAAVSEVDASEAWLAAMDSDRARGHVADVGPANVAMFSTGLGDGVYPSYWGFDAEGNTVELASDFEVLLGSTYERIELSLPLARGRFRHPLLEQHDVTMRVPLLGRSSATLGGRGHAQIEHPDGTVLGATRRPALRWYLPSDLQRDDRPDSTVYSWKDWPRLETVVLAVAIGTEALRPV